MATMQYIDIYIEIIFLLRYKIYKIDFWVIYCHYFITLIHTIRKLIYSRWILWYL